MPIPCLNICLGRDKQNTAPPPAAAAAAPPPVPVIPHPPAVNLNMTNPASAVVAASLTSGGVESVGFLNDIVAQLWDYINVAGAQMVREIVEPMFKQMPGLASLRFTKIDLGKLPIKFDNIDVHKRSKGSIKLDVDILWDGICDIEMEHRIASFGVQEIKLKGRMSVLLCPLVERLPLVTAAQIAFINPPELDLDFTGLAQIADLSFIDKTIRTVINDIIASILVLPNRLLIKIDPANDVYQSYQQQLGIVRVTLEKGTGFVVPKGFIKDIPDVYCMVRMGGSPIWQTTTVNNTVTPEWGESSDFLLSDHDQTISIEAMDDDLAGDDSLGKAVITVGKLLLAGKSSAVPLLVGNRDTGAKISLKCDILQFVPDVTSFEQPEYQAKNTICGLVTIIVAGATGIPCEKKDAASTVKVSFATFNFQTPVVCDMVGVDCLNPPYDSAFRVPLTSELAAAPTDFNFTLMNKSEPLGTVSVPWADVMNAEQLTHKAKHELGNGAALDLSVSISGVKVAT